jgi:hypothetical protein
VKSRFQNLPFKFNLQRYTAAAAGAGSEEEKEDEVGLYKLIFTRP